MLPMISLTVLLMAEAGQACSRQERTAAFDAHEGEVVSDKSATPQAKAEKVRVRLTFDGKKAVVQLRDNPSSRDFLSQLPLKLTLEDHAGTEKIAYLPKKLSTEGAPSGFDPSVGDVTYYAPWGNLAIFYKDFGYAKGLVSLGVVESGLKELAQLHGDVTVVIEKIDKK